MGSSLPAGAESNGGQLVSDYSCRNLYCRARYLCVATEVVLWGLMNVIRVLLVRGPDGKR